MTVLVYFVKINLKYSPEHFLPYFEDVIYEFVCKSHQNVLMSNAHKVESRQSDVKLVAIFEMGLINHFIKMVIW